MSICVIYVLKIKNWNCDFHFKSFIFSTEILKLYSKIKGCLINPNTRLDMYINNRIIIKTLIRNEDLFLDSLCSILSSSFMIASIYTVKIKLTKLFDSNNELPKMYLLKKNQRHPALTTIANRIYYSCSLYRIL